MQLGRRPSPEQVVRMGPAEQKVLDLSPKCDNNLAGKRSRRPDKASLSRKPATSQCKPHLQNRQCSLILVKSKTRFYTSMATWVNEEIGNLFREGIERNVAI